MQRTPNRITPQLPVGAVKTYEVDAPLSTHWRDATCEEVECQAMREGWITTVVESDAVPVPPATHHYRQLMGIADADDRRAYYIRHMSGRKFTEHRDASGVTVFDFEPGQTCFETHRVRVDRPELFIVRDGDFRGNPTGRTRTHTRPDDWVEDFAEHQDKISKRIERG